MSDEVREHVERERLVSGYTGRICILLAFGWGTIVLGRQTLPLLLPAITVDFSIGPARAGLALTVMTALYAASQYPGGRVSDRLSRIPVLVGSLLVGIVGFALLTDAGTYSNLLVAVSCVGVGAGLYNSPSRALLSDLFVERRGQAIGIQIGAGMTGGTLSAGVVVVMLAVSTWENTFIPVIGLLIVVLFLLLKWVKEPFVIGRVNLAILSTGTRILGMSKIRSLVTVYVLFAFTSQALLGFLPTFLQVEKDLSPALASGAFAMIYVIGIVSGPLGGNMSDRFSRSFVVLGALSLELVGLILLLGAPSTLLIVSGITLASAGMWAFPPVMQAFLMDLFPDENLGGDFGALKTIYTGLGSLGPYYVGVVATEANYTVAFAGLTICILSAIAILITQIRRGDGVR